MPGRLRKVSLLGKKLDHCYDLTSLKDSGPKEIQGAPKSDTSMFLIHFQSIIRFEG